MVHNNWKTPGIQNLRDSISHVDIFNLLAHHLLVALIQNVSSSCGTAGKNSSTTHQMQSRSFESLIFGTANNVDVWLVYPPIFYVQGCRSVSFFILSQDMMQKNLAFSTVEAALHKWKNVIRHPSVSTRTTTPNFLAFESCLIL